MLSEEMRAELKNICQDLFFDEPMSRYTSIRVGGGADALIYPKTVDEVAALIRYARSKKLPWMVLGAGSNLLVRDKGIRGLVLSLGRGFSEVRLEGPTTIYCESGVGLPRLVDFAATSGLAGLEMLSGIPGNLGGALVMNAGTRQGAEPHHGEIGGVVESATFVDREGRLTTWKKEKIGFGYRESHFPSGAVILSARLVLKPEAPERIRERIKKDRDHRGETQPLNVPNLGSVFKNPRKGFAGAMIEEAGLKNVRLGGARISERHANFIVNEGGATARDLLALIGLVRDKVKEKFGILLEPEVKVVGEE